MRAAHQAPFQQRQREKILANTQLWLAKYALEVVPNV